MAMAGTGLRLRCNGEKCSKAKRFGSGERRLCHSGLVSGVSTTALILELSCPPDSSIMESTALALELSFLSPCHVTCRSAFIRLIHGVRVVTERIKLFNGFQ